MTRTLQSEFPDYPAKDLPVIDGFTLETWHNDACPRFVRIEGDLRIEIFVDYLDSEKRECQGDRFTLNIMHDDELTHWVSAETLGELIATLAISSINVK